MGLDTTHDAFHGAYSAFNRFRQEICRAMGPESSFPPHYKRDEQGRLIQDERGMLVRDPLKDEELVYIDGEYSRETHPGLYEFLMHSDCDGEISPEMCAKVADDLEALLPKVEALKTVAAGHIAAAGGYVPVLERFIAGCRLAAANGEPLEFR